ncbi:hypothetical protein DH2020_020032 [Rehmannia glutinosa]|uniref:C3H1-type domain-containing protein n=1 Tax=Rehmannia glutinosa TaxID=99300 RepID=A0ABR0WH56_REHGL
MLIGLRFDFANAEPMWQLDLGGGPESYPERPDEPDCIYYLRTGFCGYGNRCRFNHPRDRNSAMGSLRTSGGDYPERIGQPVCQYYMRTGMCKFGASCKYHHPKHGVGSSAPIALNFYGYPLRPGEKECSYYVKTGQCKFGITCKFHHPQPAGIQAPAPGPGSLSAPAAVYPTVQSPSLQSSQQYGVIPGNWPVARPPMLPGSYVPGSYGPMLFPPGVVPVPGWTPYTVGVVEAKYMAQVPGSPMASPSTQPTVGSGPIYGITQLSPSSTAYTGPYVSITSAAGPSSSSHTEHAFPERPGQPECQYYLRTGDWCTTLFSLCTKWSMQIWAVMQIRSPNGNFELQSICIFSDRYACSSLPCGVHERNVGSIVVFFSSDLRPELLSGFSKDTFSSQISSSMNSSSTSVGSTFSKSGPIPQSSVQHSGPSSSGGSSTTHGTESINPAYV